MFDIHKTEIMIPSAMFRIFWCDLDMVNPSDFLIDQREPMFRLYLW